MRWRRATARHPMQELLCEITSAQTFSTAYLTRNDAIAKFSYDLFHAESFNKGQRIIELA
jgi:hypothetical protein